ncbi:signal transduction histidine kinase [Sedimentibacter acidaminivorans]|uniref:histidine kinase n=1 Tax=Sedimentibacter acidaminivorans TaxID=913099 RepID=A0ABS4GGV5_9FIRM|nr:sensor histidine kinase [Sedimentibacter acidaminivorans]MBP1926911.1 signal transduction histidine kinase [Sedimentibacter acidaminivorans]
MARAINWWYVNEDKKMHKDVIKKIGLAIFILIVIRILTIYSFYGFNLKVTDYIKDDLHTIYVDEVLETSKKALILAYNNEELYTFYIESSDKKEIAFVFEGGEYAYTIYIADELRMQNYDKTLDGYTNEIAYGVFELNERDYKEIDGRYRAKIQLQNKTINEMKPFFLLGTKDTIRKYLALRTMVNTFMGICFFVILIISSVLYRRDRDRYMFSILLISIVSVFKWSISGEVHIFSEVFGITSHNFYFFESLTTAINYFLYQSLLYTLYQFKIKRRYIILYLGLFLILASQYIFEVNGPAFLIIYLMGAIVMISMSVIGHIKDKPYSMILLTTYSVFAGFNLYWILIKLNYFKEGYLSSLMNGPQVGSIIYVLGFLIAVIKTYLNKMAQYEKQQKEYERVLLIRGISHDLKLPLSVIKLNNQMLEKYDMAGDEKKVYTKTSLEAVQELEKMTDNINAYLNLESNVGGDYTTSMKESLEKLKSHYQIYNQKNQIFIVVWEEEDYLLPIKPLQFDRMLYNLVDNAFKYNKDGGEVKVEYRLDEQVIITVEDSGIGMDQEEIDKILIPFYRIDHSRTKDGLGLGLVVVKGIVESIKGELKVESKMGIGTKIIITIPK